jgi:hypothetical protein
MALTKKQMGVIRLIETQLSINLLAHCTATKRRFISVDVSDIDIARKINMIERIGLQYQRYTVEANGYKRIALRLKEDAPDSMQP